MPDRTCPACHASLEGNVSTDGVCMACGHDLVLTAPRPNWYVANLDLRRVARRQRAVLWVVLSILIFQLLPILFANLWSATGQPAVTFAIGSAVLICHLVALILVILLVSALDYHIALRILLIVLMLAPCINLLVLLAINGRATTALRAAGLRVGLMGTSDAQVVRWLGANRCRHCGYLLVGNTSGVCPECGRRCRSELPDAQTGTGIRPEASSPQAGGGLP